MQPKKLAGNWVESWLPGKIFTHSLLINTYLLFSPQWPRTALLCGAYSCLPFGESASVLSRMAERGWTAEEMGQAAALELQWNHITVDFFQEEGWPLRRETSPLLPCAKMLGA